VIEIFPAGFSWLGNMRTEKIMSATISTRDVVNTVAREMACGVDTAVESWMAQIENASSDPHLTTIGRMNAVKEVLDTYKRMTGKTRLLYRRQVCNQP
jgi:hypothetical protein